VVNAAIEGLIARSTASGWVLCILVVGGIIQITRVVANQRPKMRELDISEGEALRTAFVGEMQALRVEIKELREENQGLRNEVRALHGIIDGMRRESLQSALSTQRAVVSTLPPEFVPEKTREALERIQGAGE
jgi:FtsZ-binding cell division protein ZapB